MKGLVVYLIFGGNCEEALNFYRSALGGEIIMKSTYGESPLPSDEKWKNKIMHAQFKADNIFFMASDAMPDQLIKPGDNISLSLDFSNEEEQAKIFNALSAGGDVTMPLEDTFWGARFGMLRDKFGIAWMLNLDKPKTQAS
jgi:PhnB protein